MYQRDKEKYKKWSRDYYLRNKERYLGWTRSWRRSNPDSIRSLVRVYRARKRNAEGVHTGMDIQRLWWFQQGCCQYCGKRLSKLGKNKYHVDHMLPLRRDGANWPSNICLACGSCNDRKHTKTYEEFMLLMDKEREEAV